MTENELTEKMERAKEYYSQFDISEPNILNWRRWLGTLPEAMAKDFYEKGFSHSLKALPFQSWYLETIKKIKPDF